MPTAPTLPPSSGDHPAGISATPRAFGTGRRSALSRRSALKVGAAVLGVAAAATAAGCAGADDDRDAEPDPLLSARSAALRDAAAASAAAALAPDRTAALGVIAAERTAHADALSTEIARAAGEDPTATTTSAAPTTTAQPVTPPTIEELRTMLTESQRGAASLARTLDGYRAGLAGSIVAAIGAEQAVLLG